MATPSLQKLGHRKPFLELNDIASHDLVVSVYHSTAWLGRLRSLLRNQVATCANMVYFRRKGRWGAYDLRVTISGKVFVEDQFVIQLRVSPLQKACRRGDMNACNQYFAEFAQENTMQMQLNEINHQNELKRIKRFAELLK
jgi:hypothetical protein